MKTRITITLDLEHPDSLPEWQLPEDRELADDIARDVGTLVSSHYLVRVSARVVPVGGSQTPDPQECIAPEFFKINR